MEKRVNRAIKEFNKTPQLVDPDTGLNHYNIQLLFSGGSSDGVSKPEGSIMMEEYALTQGIKKECMFVEDKSRTTVENLEFSKKIIEDFCPFNTLGWWRPEIVICTSSYHIRRATVLAKLIMPLFDKISFIHTEEVVTQEQQDHEWSLLFNYIHVMCDRDIK